MDGRPHRLKRGKHFVGEPKLFQREARLAAEERGRVACFSRDSQGKWGYVWVQFLDAEVKEGEPCPVCGSRELLKLNNNVMRCPSCASKLCLVPAPLEPPRPAGDPIEEDAPAARDLSELAEIVATRVLRPGGAVAVTPSSDEALVVETTVRSQQPHLRVRTNLAAEVEGQRVFAARQPEWADLGGAGLYAIQAHLPPGMLVGHHYRLKVVVEVDDRSGADPILLVRRKATKVSPPPPAPDAFFHHGFLRPTLEWTIEGLEREVLGADLASGEIGAT